MAKTKYKGFVPKDDPMFSEGWTIFGKGQLNSTSRAQIELDNHEYDTASSRSSKIDWSYFFGPYFTQAIINSEMRSKLVEELGDEFPIDKNFIKLSESEQSDLCCACCEIFKEFSTITKKISPDLSGTYIPLEIRGLAGIFYIKFGDNEYGLFENELDAEAYVVNKIIG